MTEVIFTCQRCEANYNVAHLPQPVTDCPVCGWRAKINLSLIDQAATLPNEAVRAHLSSVTPTVKSGKTRASSFNGAPGSSRFGKSADPACYHIPVGGNSAAALFDKVMR